MKKRIQRSMAIFILSAFFLCLFVNYFLQMYRAQLDMIESSQDLFRQVEQIVQQNNEELLKVTEDIRATCLQRAKTAAYMLEHRPSRITDLKELQELVDLLEVDEIHIFDKEGTIYAGNRPEYYNLSMHDGEQIGFFLPMLKDTSLSLCQDMAPNTAEGKYMQYAAVWTEDGNNIIQIGLEPTRIMELTEKNELSYIFSLLTDGSGSTLFAIDPETYTILGSTLSHTVGLNTINIGIPEEKMTDWGKGFFVTLGGIRTYAVFEKTDTVILGRIRSLENLYKSVNSGNLRLSFYLVLIFAIQWVLISKYLEISFVSAIDAINRKLQRIADGRLQERVEVNTTPEFSELSKHINSMVGKLEQELWRDELTGLYSRRGFYIELDNLFKPGAPLNYTTIIMIDSDDLKKTNDKYGHENGDKYLSSIANILAKLNIPDKIVARLSGDEFAIVIPYVDSQEEAASYLQQLKEIRDNNYLAISAEERIPLRFSVGMAVYGIDGNNYHVLLKQADSRMYEDKITRKTPPA